MWASLYEKHGLRREPATDRNGRNQFSKLGKTWALWGPNDDLITVMPPDVCDEIKNLPPQQLNFVQAIEDVRSQSVVEITVGLIRMTDLQMEFAYEHARSSSC